MNAIRSKKAFRRAAIALTSAVTLLALTWGALESADRAYPPPIASALPVSTEVIDRDGPLLRSFATPMAAGGSPPTSMPSTRNSCEMLIAYEDKRFWDHQGVDALALLRAAGQFAGNGRIVSGGSTLSMQLARLIEPRESRSLGAKTPPDLARRPDRAAHDQAARSSNAYLTLAPYGGNLEGVRAASLAYFGKEPKRLTAVGSGLACRAAAIARAPPARPQSRRCARRARPRARSAW